MIGVFAGSIVAILFNNILMRLAGADGVAAIPVGELLSIMMSIYYFSKLHFGYRSAGGDSIE